MSKRVLLYHFFVHAQFQEAEIADRLTPLRSEMRTIRAYANGRLPHVQRVPQTATVQNNLPLPSTNNYESNIHYEDDRFMI